VTKWLEIDQDNLRRETAKAVARLMSFAHITCYGCHKRKQLMFYCWCLLFQCVIFEVPRSIAAKLCLVGNLLQYKNEILTIGISYKTCQGNI